MRVAKGEDLPRLAGSAGLRALEALRAIVMRRELRVRSVGRALCGSCGGEVEVAEYSIAKACGAPPEPMSGRLQH